MATVKPSELLFYAGGECFERYGTPLRRTTIRERGGEDWGLAFARADASTVASYLDRDGYLRRALANVLRVEYVSGLGYCTLHEASRTNLCLRSEECGTAPWSTSNSSISADADTAPDGTTSADRLIEDATAGVAHWNQQGGLTITADTDVAFSVFLKAGARTWVRLRVGDATNTHFAARFFNLSSGALGAASVLGTATEKLAQIHPLGNGWWRLTFVVNIGSGVTTAVAAFFLATANDLYVYTGDGASYLSMWGAQVENAGYPSSYIKTIGSTLTRAADRLEAGFGPAPRAMTVYAHFIERARPSWTTVGGTSPRIVHIGVAGTTAPRWAAMDKQNATDVYRSVHQNIGSVSATVDLNPALGDRIELRSVLNADGSTQLHGAKNGGAESSGAASAADALASAWAGPTIVCVGALGADAQGDIALRSVKIVAGVHSMDELRAAVPS